MKKGKSSVRFVTVAMLCAVSFVLFLLEFPIFPGASHLKLDLSDVPALLGAMIYGPAWGVVIELVKNLIELAVKGLGTQLGFGNLMNFIVGSAFVVPFALLYKRCGALLASVCGVVSITLIGIGANYFIDPLFFKFFLNITLDSESLWAAIWSATAINAIKGVLLGVLGVTLLPALLRRLNLKRLV